MDLYCIQVGSMIDNGLPTLEYAHEHTIHCLVDVSFCRNSGFEILAPNDNGTYDRAVVLDDFGNEEVIRIARSVGQCSTCTGDGTQQTNFFVTVQGELVDATGVGDSDVDPPLLQVTSMTVDGTCPTPAPVTAAPVTSAPTSPAPVVASTSTSEPTSFEDSSAPSTIVGVESLVPSVADEIESAAPTEVEDTTVPVSTLAPVTPAPTTPAPVAASVCLTGVPMDLYCIQVGSMIDNGLPTLEYAHEHTIHCLVDVSFCRNSGFEILAPNESGTYDRAVVLDDFGNEEVIRIARAVGQCSTCTGGGSQQTNFFVTVEGELVDASSVGDSDANPPLLRVTSMTVDGTCSTTTPGTLTTANTLSSSASINKPDSTSSIGRNLVFNAGCFLPVLALLALLI